MTCEKCGATDQNGTFCSQCGEKLLPVESQTNINTDTDANITQTPEIHVVPENSIPFKDKSYINYYADYDYMDVDGKGSYIFRHPNNGVTLIHKAIELISRKSMQLCGVILMGELLTCLAVVLGILPLIYLPVVFGLEMGMTGVFIAAVRGQDVSNRMLLEPFSDIHRFGRYVGGMAWMKLWILIWSLIPIVGPVFGIIKAYSYKFAPYILIEEPDIPITEAIRVSAQRTYGVKGRMFIADLIPSSIVFVVALGFLLLSLIKGVGLFFLPFLIFILLVAALSLPLVLGLIGGICYEEFGKKGIKI